MIKIFKIITTLFIITSCVNDIIDESYIIQENSDNIVDVNTKSDDNVTYYWYKNEKRYLPIIEDCYFAVFRSSTLERASELSSLKAGIEFKDYKIHALTTRQSNKLDKYLWAKIDTDIAEAYSDEIVYLAPYLKGSISELGVTDMFYVKLKSENDYNLLVDFANENGVEIIKTNDASLWYTLVCANNTTENALDLSNKAYESGMFAKTDIELMGNLIWCDSSNYYNDTYYSGYQWNLHGIYGIDVKNVHSITTGDPSILVSIVDSGIQLNHPDITIYDSWDASYGRYPAQLYPEASQPYSHGTGMTGIIGATTNNDIGIAGIAPNVSLIPISMGYNPTVGTIVSAINHAVASGAKVINNSYVLNEPIEAVEEAFENAIDNGCIIVQGSGNFNSTSLGYPYAVIPEIITVGAINIDGERWVDVNYPTNGSTYGTNIDIVAPGTDIISLDYNNYYYLYTGTSPACSHVTATAALMLSVNPNLTRQQVTDIIESTAKKLPAYDFEEIQGRPNGTWNEEVGYGLVNTLDAVNLAKGYYNLISFDYSEENISFTITANKDIAVIWDWETEDITEVEISSSSTHTFTHTFSTTETRRIYIAEMIDFETEEVPLFSTAVTEFDLTTGNYASNFEFRPINEALTDIQIIGGSDFESQDIMFSHLQALEYLYLINVQNANVTLYNCPELTMFSTSRFIWYDWSEIQSPYVIGPVHAWPTYPESVTSLMSLEIYDCPSIHTLSLENVGLTNLSFEGLPQLNYVYLSSQSSKIVCGTDNYFSPTGSGVFLKNAINTLPAVTGITPGILTIRCVSDNNMSFIPINIATGHLNTIITTAEEKNWDIIWDYED